MMANTRNILRVVYDPASYIHDSWIVKFGFEAARLRPAVNRLLISRLSLSTAIDPKIVESESLRQGHGLASVLECWDAMPAALQLLGALALKPLLPNAGLKLNHRARSFLNIPLYFPTVLSIGSKSPGAATDRLDKSLLVACGQHVIEPLSRHWPAALNQRLPLLWPADGPLGFVPNPSGDALEAGEVRLRARQLVLAAPPAALLISTLKMALNHASRN
jgi:hypothetical protein